MWTDEETGEIEVWNDYTWEEISSNVGVPKQHRKPFQIPREYLNYIVTTTEDECQRTKVQEGVKNMRKRRYRKVIQI